MGLVTSKRATKRSRTSKRATENEHLPSDQHMESEGLLTSDNREEVVALRDILDVVVETDSSDDGNEATISKQPSTPAKASTSTRPSSSGASSSGMNDEDRLHSLRKGAAIDCKGWTCNEICNRLRYQKTEVPWRLVQRGPPSSDWDHEGEVIGLASQEMARCR